jgi:hypothetical protein
MELDLTIKSLISRKLTVFLLGLLLGCGCVVGIGAAKSQQTTDSTTKQYFEDTPEMMIICNGGVSYMVMGVIRGDRMAAMGLTVMLTPMGTPLFCVEE